MEDPFFGATAEGRKAYFLSVQKKFERSDIYYDSYYQAPQDYYPELHDAFLLLPKALKEIYQVAADLDDTIKVFQKSTSVLEQKLIINTLDRQATRLNNLILKAKIHSSPILSSLKKGADQVLAMLDGARFELDKARLKMISSDDLKSIVCEALSEYENINHLSKQPTYRFFDIFKKHNQAGKALATGLLDKINALTNPTALNVFEMIDNHLASGKGAWGKQSFKTILAKKLGEVSAFSFDQWPSYLSNTSAEKKQEPGV